MSDERVQQANPLDPTVNVKSIVEEASSRQDDLRNAELRRLDEKIASDNEKYQIQFDAARDAVKAALDGTREAINKADATTDKRFDLLSEKIDGIADSISKSSGAQAIYVTHDDLSIAIDKLQNSIQNTLQPVVAFMNSQTGRENGTQGSWMYIVQGIGIISALVVIFLGLSGHIH